MRPKVTGLPTNGFVLKGSTISLICVASGDVQVDTFKWFKSGMAVQSSGVKDATYTKAGALETDTGKYSCRAINAEGESESLSVSVTVIVGKFMTSSRKLEPSSSVKHHHLINAQGIMNRLTMTSTFMRIFGKQNLGTSLL
jgi:hypothetical protein